MGYRVREAAVTKIYPAVQIWQTRCNRLLAGGYFKAAVLFAAGYKRGRNTLFNLHDCGLAVCCQDSAQQAVIRENLTGLPVGLHMNRDHRWN